MISKVTKLFFFTLLPLSVIVSTISIITDVIWQNINYEFNVKIYSMILNQISPTILLITSISFGIVSLLFLVVEIFHLSRSTNKYILIPIPLNWIFVPIFMSTMGWITLLGAFIISILKNEKLYIVLLSIEIAAALIGVLIMCYLYFKNKKYMLDQRKLSNIDILISNSGTTNITDESIYKINGLVQDIEDIKLNATNKKN